MDACSHAQDCGGSHSGKVFGVKCSVCVGHRAQPNIFFFYCRTFVSVESVKGFIDVAVFVLIFVVCLIFMFRKLQ